MNTLATENINDKLEDLHQQAAADFKIRKSKEQETGEVQSKTTAFMSVSPEEGKLLYQLIRTAKAKNIVEYGCSFGISTIYLAAAAKDNGGKVITTELEPNKVEGAKENLKSVNLKDWVTILQGDATKTLTKVEGPVEFLFLDGAKEYYLPIFKMFESKLAKGAVVVADNADKITSKPFVEYITALPEKYTSSLLFDGRMLVSYVH